MLSCNAKGHKNTLFLFRPCDCPACFSAAHVILSGCIELSGTETGEKLLYPRWRCSLLAFSTEVAYQESAPVCCFARPHLENLPTPVVFIEPLAALSSRLWDLKGAGRFPTFDTQVRSFIYTFFFATDAYVAALRILLLAVALLTFLCQAVTFRCRFGRPKSQRP